MTIALSLTQAASIVNGELASRNEVSFDQVTIDTRNLQTGELFIAIKGEQFDGHDFIGEAFQKGAAAAIVSDHSIKSSFPLIYVKDTRIALGLLAAHRRQQCNIPVIAVTGSCGKTTTRSMLESIMQQCGSVLASASSLNNDIGLPLTLLKLSEQHQFLILECGMNHFGELSYLSKIAQPTVAIITNIGPVHLEGVGDIDGVARAKGELFEGLIDNGTAVFEIDSPYYQKFWQEHLNHKNITTFGISDKANVSARNVVIAENGRASFTLVTAQDQIQIHLPLLGQHNVINALAAAAACLAVGANLSQIKAGLENITPVTKRLVEHVTKAGAYLIDDTYNANPASVKAAIEVLIHVPKSQRILILGDMRELGKNAEELHRQIGFAAKQAGIHSLYACGELSGNTVQGFGQNGHHFPSQQALISAVKPLLKNDVALLVKGSRGAKMENVVQGLLEVGV